MAKIETIRMKDLGVLDQDAATTLRVRPKEAPKLPLRPKRFAHRNLDSAAVTVLRVPPKDVA